MGTVFQTILSISSSVLQNCLFNKVCKKDLKTSSHIYRFNIIVYLVCMLLFGAALISESLSWFTAALGIVFGVVTALSNFYRMRALSDDNPHNVGCVLR